ncbi:hypothetical protein VP1G_11276 [Cytospora mali]|uniref:Uncharacterized protein n=1 Tax=Cytospora mali TaxID=578113 RepID=A0A194VAG8_CYTMA|nr:hypothetical protein VP1G_11276 [Valsa mali var. pyri (nom. inval.)]
MPAFYLDDVQPRQRSNVSSAFIHIPTQNIKSRVFETFALARTAESTPVLRQCTDQMYQAQTVFPALSKAMD